METKTSVCHPIATSGMNATAFDLKFGSSTFYPLHVLARIPKVPLIHWMMESLSTIILRTEMVVAQKLFYDADFARDHRSTEICFSAILKILSLLVWGDEAS